jgi:S1/P1 Nuclease
MRKHLLRGAMVALSLLSARAAFAWNATGHEIVAFVAWSQLTPQAKAQVNALLSQHPDYARTFTRDSVPAAERDEQAFAIAATWPDLIRSQSFGASSKYARSNWHYVDMPFVVGNFPPPPASDLSWSPGKEPENAIQAIRKNIADLKNTNLPVVDRAVALCWIEHLIGDIHQPLHATSMFSATFPEGDKGGNSQFLSVNGRSLNLHSLWDGMVGGYMPIADVKKIADKLIAAHPHSEFDKDLADTNPDDWAKQSYEQAKKVVYLDGKLATSSTRGGDAPQLPAGYLDAAKPIAGRDATLGGMRLADTLNTIFAEIPPTTLPAATTTAP